MGWKCCVQNCKIGYDSEKVEEIKVSFHSFPADPDVREVWVKHIDNKNWEPKPTSRVCSIHFEDEDFQMGSKGS